MPDTDFFTDSERVKPIPPDLFEQLLKQQAAQKGQTRHNKLLDALTTIGVIAIYLVPTVLALLYITVLANKAWMGEWVSLEDTLQGLLVPITTYLAGMMSKNVLDKHGH